MSYKMYARQCRTVKPYLMVFISSKVNEDEAVAQNMKRRTTRPRDHVYDYVKMSRATNH